jgi:hypothetical protein
MRVEPGQASVVCDTSETSVPVSPLVAEAVQQAFEAADPRAWCLDGVFIADMPCMAAGHRLARRLGDLLSAGYDRR